MAENGTKRVIQVAPVPAPKTTPLTIERRLAQLCYFYPQYTYGQARRLPYKRVVMLLAEARREEARKRYDELMTARAAHSDEGFEQLSNHLRDIMNG